jgi:ankyrin repeat protein
LKQVKSALGNLTKSPDALEKAYESALERIKNQPKSHFERAKKVLWWITLAKRPLTVDEICCALAVEPGDTELDRDNIPDAEDLVSVCAGLVDIDSKGRHGRIFRFIHYTTQEYFERIIDTWISGGQLYVAQTCLTYLSFQKDRRGRCSTATQYRMALSQNEFLHYADLYWGQHVQPVEVEVAAQTCSFLLGDDLVVSAQQAVIRPLFNLTAEYELVYTAEEIMRRLENHDTKAIDWINAGDSFGDIPLFTAVRRNSYKMVRFLLEKGANFNAIYGGRRTPLAIAVACGKEEVVKLLLEHGADFDTGIGFWSNPLFLASESGHEQIVKMLIEKGASVERKGAEHSTALYAAIRRGYEGIVKLLLEYGATPGDEALYLATTEGYAQIVHMLLEHGAVSEVEALCTAATRGDIQIVQLLLDKGAEVNAKNGYRGTAIFAASRNGHSRVVKLLLERGADPGVECTYDNITPLYRATKIGHIEVVRLLLQHGADPNAPVGQSGSILKMAVESGNEELVALLKANGAVL